MQNVNAMDGQAAKRTTTEIIVSVRITRDLETRLEARLEAMRRQHAGLSVTRSGMIRFALERLLEDMDAQDARNAWNLAAQSTPDPDQQGERKLA